MKKNSGIKLTSIAALGIVSVVVIAAALYFYTPETQSGGIGCLFYSAQPKSFGYVVYATLSNNSTSPVAIQRVYFDGSEQAYSTEFLENIGGIWSMKAGSQYTNVLGAGGVSILLLTSTEANASMAHTVRVVTNTSNLEFNVEQKLSSIALNNYTAFEGPGIDYLIAYVNNVGTVTGNIVQVAIDGADFEYVCNMRPPSYKHQWSMAIGGSPTAFIGIGQQALIYVSMTEICHTCTHIMRVACIDGSSVEFSFKLR
jgi:hypothetical protein